MSATYQILCQNRHYFITDVATDVICTCGAGPKYVFIVEDLSGFVEGSSPRKNFVKIGVDKNGRDIYKVGTD